jgi:hypothetical protein
MDATGMGSFDMAFNIIEEEHFCWLHTQTLPGQFKDAPIRLGKADLMRVGERSTSSSGFRQASDKYDCAS